MKIKKIDKNLIIFEQNHPLNPIEIASLTQPNNDRISTGAVEYIIDVFNKQEVHYYEII